MKVPRLMSETKNHKNPKLPNERCQSKKSLNQQFTDFNLVLIARLKVLLEVGILHFRERKNRTFVEAPKTEIALSKAKRKFFICGYFWLQADLWFYDWLKFVLELKYGPINSSSKVLNKRNYFS